MNSTTHATSVAHVPAEVLAQFVELVDCWASAPQIAWELAGEDAKERSNIYRVLRKLAAAGIWQLIEVRHNDEWMYVYKVDIAAITGHLAGRQ